MRNFFALINCWGPFGIVLLSTLLLTMTWIEYRQSRELWRIQEASFDRLRTETLAKLLKERSEILSRLESGRAERQSRNQQLLERLEADMLHFENMPLPMKELPRLSEGQS